MTLPGPRRGDVALLRRRLAAARVPVDDGASRLDAASRDYAWLSPVLTTRLAGRRAELVAAPRTPDELACCLAEAVRCEVPVTARGRGTGNYGQSVPLEGGLVVDCTDLDALVDLGPGWARAAPGISCQTLERLARADGQELALFPSTTQSTLGGFVAGGAGGSGSIEHGFVWDGFVLAAEILPATVPASPLRVARSSPDTAGGAAGDPLRPFLHTYGTTGVIGELTVRLDPARPWTGLAASFARLEAAAEAARALLEAGTRLRLLGVTEAALVATFPARAWLDPASASLRAVVDEEQRPEAAALLVRHGGRIERSGAELVGPITQRSYNHVTLWAKRADPSAFHLQLGGLEDPRRLAAARRACRGARLHLDAMRGPDGPGLGGLLIAPFVSEAALAGTVGALVAEGLRVVDPHTFAVPDPDGHLAETAERLDPAGLLNPGKLRRAPGSPRSPRGSPTSR